VALRYLLPVLLSRGGCSAEGKPTLIYRRSAALLVAAVLGVLMVAQLYYYFNIHVPLLEKQARLYKPYGDVFDLAIRSFDFPNLTDIYMIGEPVPDINVPRAWIGMFARSDSATLRYFPLSSLQFTPEFVDQLPLDHNLALFIDSSSQAAIALMRVSFGCAMQHSPYPIDPPEKEFLLCFVPIRRGG
jgi:hypothetical protein